MTNDKAREDRLIGLALDAREKAIAPYSNFKVGAVIQSADGTIFSGCNIENASFSLTVCAERVALLKALSEGYRTFEAVCVVAEGDRITTPCGPCRQLLWEFCGDVPVIMATTDGKRAAATLGTLLPNAFDASFLEK
jgi:cytidine deaminase